MYYFAYGSNIDERTMKQACPNARLVGAGRLDGHRVEFTLYSDKWGGGAANVQPDPDGHVWGVVWEVTEEDLDRLDTYEGHPTFYRREQVTVQMGDEAVECTTYRVAHQEGYIRPSDTYLNLVRSAMRVHGLPPEALDMFEQAAMPPKPHI
ncbi:MAG TPA: gamma-glutamylcyclotransferase family protein [Actinomycetota bacterium]|nr:gamma-glutamylcyclotransferase family protein [Actinomycetota bacterium]